MIAALVIRNFCYWLKYSVFGFMYVHSHKFPTYDVEFLHLQALKQNFSVDMQELHSKPEDKILNCHFILII